MPLLPNTVPDTNPVRRLPPFTTLNLTPEPTPDSGPNRGPNHSSNCSPDSGTNPSPSSGSNLGPTTRYRTARKKPLTQTPTHKPRKAGPQSRQGKRIHDIFGAPLKIYNPRRTAVLRAQQKARKNGATPKEINAAGHGRKVRRSHPGSKTPISSWTNPCGRITRNPPLSEEYWDVHSTPQFHEIGP